MATRHPRTEAFLIWAFGDLGHLTGRRFHIGILVMGLVGLGIGLAVTLLLPHWVSAIVLLACIFVLGWLVKVLAGLGWPPPR
jgi:hypothetical protein